MTRTGIIPCRCSLIDLGPDNGRGNRFPKKFIHKGQGPLFGKLSAFL